MRIMIATRHAVGALVVLESFNALVFGYLYEHLILGAAFTLAIASAGGFVVRVNIQSDRDWTSFAVLYSWLYLSIGLIGALVDGFDIKIFLAYLLVWLVVKVPLLFFFVWLGDMAGKNWLTRVRQKKSSGHP